MMGPGEDVLLATWQNSGGGARPAHTRGDGPQATPWPTAGWTEGVHTAQPTLRSQEPLGGSTGELDGNHADPRLHVETRARERIPTGSPDEGNLQA